MARVGLTATVRGDREVIQALRQLPPNAQREARAGAVRLSRELANIIRAAGRSDTRQSARASRTVRTATAGLDPQVIAGPHPMLFGSEFGIKRRTGWYARPRYLDSPARQYRPHFNSGYWFRPTYLANGERIQAAAAEMADAIVRSWSA